MTSRWDEPLSPPPDGAQPLTTIEISFGHPVYLTPDDYRELNRVIEAIVQGSCNQPQGGVHWVSGYGSRPQFSAVDARLLGLAPAPEGSRPDDGEEPTFDDTVYQIHTSARPFANSEERAWWAKRRQGP